MAELDSICKVGQPASKRRKMKTVSPVQTAAMLDFLERHPELAVKKRRSNAGTLWAECADVLNALADNFDGPTRTGAQWAKFFSDLKYRARRKALALKIAEGCSIPGEELTPLTPLEERMLSLIGEKRICPIVVKGGKGVEDDPLYVFDSDEDDDFCVPSDLASTNTSENSLEKPFATKDGEKEKHTNEDLVANLTDNTNKVATNTDKTNEIATNTAKTNKVVTNTDKTNRVATNTDKIYTVAKNTDKTNQFATNTDKTNKVATNTDKTNNNNNNPDATKTQVKGVTTNATDKIDEKDYNNKNAGNVIINDENSVYLDEEEARDNRKRRRVEIIEKDKDCNNERPQMIGNGYSSNDFEEDDGSHTDLFLRLEERKVANIERIADAVCSLRDDLSRAVDVLTNMQAFFMRR